MIHNLIERLNVENGRIYKEKTLRQIIREVPDFVSILERTYNPRWVYNVRKFDCEGKGSETLKSLWLEVEGLLHDLHHRIITGNAAKEACSEMAARMIPEEAEVFKNILKGDLRCGINVSTINKVVAGLIPEVPYMRCSLESNSNLENFPWERGVFSQEKADGMFVNVVIDFDGKVSILSRNGSEFVNETMRPFVQDVIQTCKIGHVYMGEMLVLEDGEVMSREDGNGVMNSVLKGGSFKENQEPMMMVWDVIPYIAWLDGIYKKPYLERWQEVTVLNGKYIKVIDTKIATSIRQAYTHYAIMQEQGKEGTILKNPFAIWKDGTSKDQVKLKLECDVELKVVGFNAGSGKFEDLFGSLICESSDGKLQVSVSGFSDEMRKQIHEDREDWIGKIVTVRSNNIMYNEKGPHRLFLPRFIEERLDKTEADSFEKIVETFNSAMNRT